MFDRLNKFSLLFFVFFTTTLFVSGQITKSPFTVLGIGELEGNSFVHNQGNGGLGISNGYYWNLNNSNPALLPFNSFTNFSTGFSGTSRNVKTLNTTERNFFGNLNYLALAFPIIRGKWTTLVGLMPYSDVNYQYNYSKKINSTNLDVVIIEEGKGGFNQVYWSNGVAINKRFFIGAKVSYLFSSIEKSAQNIIQFDSTSYQDINNSYIPVVVDRISISDFNYQLGLYYNKDSIFNSSKKLNFGLTYDVGKNMDISRYKALDKTNRGGSLIKIDTLFDNVKEKIKIPYSFGLGISLNEGFNWMVGIDYRFQNWGGFESVDRPNRPYRNSTKIILGGDYTPDPTSATRYFNRLTYRLGFFYENTPFFVENTEFSSQVRNFGINFGTSLPVNRISSLDIAFSVGRRGNIDKTVIEESYFKVYIGLSVNDQWFIRRKYD